VTLNLLLSFLQLVTHAPGWSDPVISVQNYVTDESVRKDLVVTDGNHVHQVWYGYQEQPRIGYNIVLPDGTILYPDVMLSRDVLSGYPTCSTDGNDSIAGFWREVSPTWYGLRQNTGDEILAPTLFSTQGFSSTPEVMTSWDSLGRIHMAYDGGPLTFYSVLQPGAGEVFLDTIPDSMRLPHILVDGDRVHIVFQGLDQLADYIQYDLDGDITVPAVDLVTDALPNSDYASISVDSGGNALIVVREDIQNESNRLCLFKVDRDSGSLLIDDLLLHEAANGGLSEPFILPTATADWFYIMWREEDSSGNYRYIKCAVIDSDGSFVESPYDAYDYTDETYELRRLRATVNEQGDVFVHWSYPDLSAPAAWIYLGWFDHNWLGVEEETEPAPRSDFTLSASQNPFTDTVTFTADADPLPAQLAVYDINVRVIC
jgi:hypothetical protein